METIRREALRVFDIDRHPPVSVLTSENRTTWAKVCMRVLVCVLMQIDRRFAGKYVHFILSQARAHLMKISDTNVASLRKIESALIVLSLDQNSPVSDEEVL